MVSSRRTVLATVLTAALPATGGCARLFDDGTDRDGPNSTDGPESDEPATVEDDVILFVEDLAAGRFETAYDRLSTSARAARDVGELERIWMGYTAVGGAFEEIVDTAWTSEFNAIDVTMRFDRTTAVLRAGVDADLDISKVSVGWHGKYERPAYVDLDAIADAEITLEPWGPDDSPPANSCSLAGRVTAPTAEDGVRGVVLVPDLDQIGMNHWYLGSRPFQDLAEGLATRGFATLRYNNRTFACRRNLRDADRTLDAVTVDDALVAIDELRGVEGVDPDRIVVAGLGLGGLAVPRIADRDGDLAGGVALAAPCRPYHEVVLDEVEHLATVGEYEWTERQQQYDRWRTQVDRLRDGEYDPDETIVGRPGALWRSLEAYDHVETARAIDDPLLFLQGERDFEVSVEDDFALWRSELADRPETAFESHDGLNHLFMPGEGPSVSFEYAVRNNVDDPLVDDLAEWIGEL